MAEILEVLMGHAKVIAATAATGIILTFGVASILKEVQLLFSLTKIRFQLLIATIFSLVVFVIHLYTNLADNGKQQGVEKTMNVLIDGLIVGLGTYFAIGLAVIVVQLLKRRDAT